MAYMLLDIAFQNLNNIHTKKRRLTAPLLNLLFLVAAFIGLFSLF